MFPAGVVRSHGAAGGGPGRGHQARTANWERKNLPMKNWRKNLPMKNWRKNLPMKNWRICITLFGTSVFNMLCTDEASLCSFMAYMTSQSGDESPAD